MSAARSGFRLAWSREVAKGRVAGQCWYTGTRYVSRYVQELTAGLLEVIWHLGGSAAL